MFYCEYCAAVNRELSRGPPPLTGAGNIGAVIDAHHHLWDPDAREYRWLRGGQPWASDQEIATLRRTFTLRELAPLAAGAGVTGTVVVQTVDDVWETEDMLSLAAGADPWSALAGDSHGGGAHGGHGGGSHGGGDGHPLVVGVVGWVDLAAPNVKDVVASLRSHPGGASLRGIRHPLLGEPDPDWLVRPDVLNGLRELADLGMCFDVIGPLRQLEAAVTAAQSVPELRFVLNHMGGPPVDTGQPAMDDTWASVVRRLGALPNVACKVSGMHSPSTRASTLRPYFETVLEVFGPDRLMFGSDWPVSSLAAGYGEVCEMYRELTTPLTSAEQDAIYDATARRVYGLDVPSR